MRGNRTGIMFNNEMDDFSTPGTSNVYGFPASPSNYIVPGKMPLSSMSPSLVFNQHGDAELLAGASGGSKIISATAQVLHWCGSQGSNYTSLYFPGHHEQPVVQDEPDCQCRSAEITPSVGSRYHLL